LSPEALRMLTARANSARKRQAVRGRRRHPTTLGGLALLQIPSTCGAVRRQAVVGYVLGTGRSRVQFLRPSSDGGSTDRAR
jgi:hypothetical protein